MIFLNNLFGGGGSGGGQGGDPIDYVNGSITVTLPQTSFIHGDTFNTSGATVTYTSPAGETTDVTSAASFDPSNGSTLNIDGENTVRVSYTPEGKDTVYATQIITVAAVPTELYVTLHDNGMRSGDAISYRGAIVKALMSDRTEKDVSNQTLTWSPLEGTVQSTEGSVNITCSYTENGVTVNGSAEMNVTGKTLTGITMTLGKTNYFYGESFDDTNTVVTATYSDDTTANVKSKCEFLPEVRSKLETTGNVTVFCTYTENAVTKVVTGTINVQKVPMELKVTFSDNGFREGDYLAYTNATVMARWSDGTNSDVTSLCTWNPAAGTILDRSGTQTVTATYHTDDWDISGSSIINVTELKLQSIGASFTKKNYRDGDGLDLTGSKVTALYDNGSIQDVTANASWSPSEGATLKKGDNKVTCTYRENSKTASVDIPITVAYVTSIAISGLDSSYDANDNISYDNAVVTATYSDGSTAVVTDSVTWSPSDGHKLETTDTTVRATYRDNSNITHTATKSITVNDIPVSLEVQMSVTDYEKGDSLNTAGSSVVLKYASGEEQSLGVNDVTWNPANGTTLNTIGTQYITVTYTSGGKTITDRISVRVSAKNETEASDKKKQTGGDTAAALGATGLTDAEKEAAGEYLGETVTGEDGKTYVKSKKIAGLAKQLANQNKYDTPTKSYRFGNVAALKVDTLGSRQASLIPGGNSHLCYGPIFINEDSKYDYVSLSASDSDISDMYLALVDYNGELYGLVSGGHRIGWVGFDSPDATSFSRGGGGFQNKSTFNGTNIAMPITTVGNLLSLGQYGDIHEDSTGGAKIDGLSQKTDDEVENEIETRAEANNAKRTYMDHGVPTEYVAVTDANGDPIDFLAMLGF